MGRRHHLGKHFSNRSAGPSVDATRRSVEVLDHTKIEKASRPDVALYVLNQKRAHLHELEQRFQVSVTISADPAINGQIPFVIEKGEQVHSLEQARILAVSLRLRRSSHE